MEFREYCLICCNGFQSSTSRCDGLDCKCLVCTDCFVTYIKSNILELAFDQEKPLPCLGACGSTHSMEQILAIVALNARHDEIDQALLARYLSRAKDIRGCPAQKCSFFGIIPEKKCSQNLICTQCGIFSKMMLGGTWQCFELMSFRLKLYNVLKNLYRSKEFLTLTYEFLLTTNCPNCTIPIYKNGGCTHMTCKGCNHEFCWVCKQNYHQHNPTACLSHVLTYYGVLLNFLFNFFIYYGFHISIFNGIVYTFLIILNCFLHNSIIGIVVFFLKFLFDGFKYWRMLRKSAPNGNLYYEKQRNMAFIMLLVLTALMIVALMTINFYTEITFVSWIQYLLIELGLATGCGLTGFGISIASAVVISKWILFVR